MLSIIRKICQQLCLRTCSRWFLLLLSSILFKVIGITYICEFSADICRDAGYQAVAGQIEVLGKLTVMFAGLPILFAVIEQIQSFL